MTKPVSEVINDLRTFPCLSGLKDEDLAALGGQAHVSTFQKHEVLFREGDPANFIFIVKAGRIKLYKTSPEGRELSIKILGPSEYFCCAPLYHEGKYSVNAVAKEDSALVVIPARHFKNLLGLSVNDIGLRMIAGLCKKIIYLSGLVEEISFRDVEQRIMLTLLRLSEEKSADKNVVPLAVTHQDIASMTGTVREVVSRTMLKLKKEGIIVESSAKGFKVDKEKLSNLLR